MNRLNRNPFNNTGSMSSVISGNFDDDDTSSVISGTHSGRPSRLHSDITLEFIDEFFNPLSNKKPSDRKITPGTNLQSATGGRGLTRDRFSSSSASTTSSKSDFQFKTQEYLPFHVAREKSNNFEYAKIRQQYENKYWEQVDNQSQVGSTLRSDEMSSVVGSAMSQIESVTTISTTKSTKQKLMNQMRQIEKINIEEEDIELEASFDMNNNLHADVNQILNQTNDLDTTLNLEQERQTRLEEILKIYKLRYDYDPKLPITQRRDEIISLIEKKDAHTQFTIIQGGTGCGKTTQIPQYILDHYMKQKKYCNIIVTQPRRIAAISVSRRVCHERGWNHGSFCGYQIGLDRSKLSEDTRITYCTTGVLLQKLIGPMAEENFNSFYTHIILDEVHERDLDTDFVMLLIKLKSYGRLDAKIILMSATISIDIFSEYFSMRLKNNLSVKYLDGRSSDYIHPPHVEIKSKLYNVSEFYWETLTSNDSFLSPIITHIFHESKKFKRAKAPRQSVTRKDALLNCESPSAFRNQLASVQFSKEEPDMYLECMMLVIALLRYFDESENSATRNSENFLNDDEEEFFEDGNRVRIIDGFSELRGSVLIFVPGMEYIKQLQELISEELPDDKLNILPLHSDIVINQQNRVFDKSEATWRKVIISTSIAESSITVPDVKYVIDFGLTKELYCDPYTNYSHLRLEWASVSSLDQRRGRAGRVSDGICYRLIPRQFMSELEKFPIPAILREPLDRVILNVKRLGRKEEPKQVLAMAIQPPKLIDIERTTLLLKEVGALSLKKNVIYDGDLTYAGRIMANLPIDVRLSKLILLGHAFGKLRECIIIAAGLSTKTFFTCYYKSHLESFKAKWIWSEGWMCDCVTLLNAYNVYESHMRRGGFSRPGEAESWARKNMIELVRIREVENLVSELVKRLRRLGIECNRHVKLDKLGNYKKSDLYDIDDEEELVKNNFILKMIFAGAFYPNYFTSIKIDLQEAIRMCYGKDFRNTVQVRNFPMEEGVLYSEKLCDMFKVCSKLVRCSFEDSKGFIEFNSKCEEVASNVNLGVFLAVQMRNLRIPLRLKRLNAKITHEKLKRLRQLRKSTSSNFNFTLNSSRTSRTSRSSNLNTTASDTESNVSDHTIINSDDDEEDKILDPERYIRDKRQKYLSYKTLEKTFDQSVSMLSADLANLDNEQSLAQFLSDPKYLLPSDVDEGKAIEITITEAIECAHFYAQINDKNHMEDLQHIHQSLNSNYHFEKMSVDDMRPNSLCVTYYTDKEIGKAFYRARILEINESELTVKLVFIDYGNRARRNFKDLFYLTDDLKEYPCQALECKILNVKPSLLQNPKGVWTKQSTSTFNRLISDEKYDFFEIFVHGLDENLAYINLFATTKNGTRDDFTNLLVKYGCADQMNKTEIDLNLSKQYNKQHNDLYYITSRDSDYMPSRPRYTNQDTELRRSEKQSKFRNKYYDGGNEANDQDDLRMSLLSINSDTPRGDVDYDENDESSYDGYIELRGPYSPLECSYHSILNVGQSKKVRVERDSINYVTLDDDPTNESTRLMIAQEVTLNQQGNTMILRKTCLMPKLPGLPTICTLLFAPTVEFRTDRQETTYTGALCGLGFDDQNKVPIYTDNDIEMAFDVKIDANDITMINSVRMAINMVIGSEKEVQTWTNEEKNLRLLQQRACEKLLRLILRNREIIEPQYFSRPYKWNQVDKSHLIDPLQMENSSLIFNDGYYTHHKAVLLNEPDN